MKRFFAIPLLVLGFAALVMAQPQTGTINSSNLVFTVTGIGNNATANIQIDGTFTSTLSFEGTTNGVTWMPIAVVPPTTAGSRVTYTTAAGVWQANVAGLFRVRVKTSVITGSATITVRLSTAPSPFGSSAALRRDGWIDAWMTDPRERVWRGVAVG